MNMNIDKLRVGAKVRVSADITGYSVSPVGVVTNIDYCLGEAIISVDYIEPLIVGGRSGCTVSNIGLLEPL